ncbi:MAG: OPT/YSL family transporter [Deltaproteobacteria bacterium]|nr:OPT/YSL family transporter [Deltaproteobacteria bacterium]
MLLLLDSRTTFPAVDMPGVTFAAGEQTMTGPDDKLYHVAYVRDDLKDPAGKPITRGKYLVDDKGTPMFFADPAVDSAYPYRLRVAKGALPVGITEAAKDAKDAATAKKNLLVDGKIVGETDGTDHGIDRQPYRVVVLSTEVNGLSAGRYLVDSAGKVAYEAEPLEKFDAPKAQLFALIIDGTLGGKLPWGMVLIGVMLAIILELVNVSSLPFAVGLYLPISTSGGIFVGGAVRWLIDRRRRGESEAEAEFSPGMLMASGLIAGGAIAGVAQSAILTAGADKAFDWSGILPEFMATSETWWPMIPFMAMAGALYWAGTRKKS